MTQSQVTLGRCCELAGAGRLAEAGELAARALHEDGDDGQLWRFFGLLRHQEGNYDGAREALETAGSLVPLDPATRRALAECLARTGHRVPAGDLYRELAGDARCPDALLPAVAAGLGHLGHFAEALGVCRELVRRDPSHPEAHFGVAFYLRRLGRPIAAALPSVERAHDLAPEVPLYRVALATMLDHVGRRDEAYDLLRDLDLDGVSCRCCLRRMTTIFLAAGDLGRGEDCRSKAGEAAPGD